MSEVEKLEVVLDAQTGRFKKAMDAILSIVRGNLKAVQHTMDSVRMDTPKGITQTMSSVDKIRLKMKMLSADMKVASGAYKYTDQFKVMSQELQDATERARNLEETIKVLNSHASSADALGNTELGDLYREGAEQSSAELEGVNAQIETVRDSIIGLANSGNLVESAGLVGKIRAIGGAFLGLGKTVGSAVAPVIRRAGGIAASLIHRFANGISHLISFRKAANSAGGGLGNMIKSMFGVQIAMKALGAAASWVRSNLTTGFQNMASAMPTGAVASNINILRNSLTQLKNACASAAAPIFNVLAPALNSLIQIAISAANAVGALMAALTGQKFVAASAGTAGVASSLGSAADNADSANTAAQKLKRTLMGFDQINKLDDADSDSGSGGSGGGGGGGGGGIGTGFEEAGIPSQIAAFAEKIKEAWKTADFTEIGTIVGTKIKNALDSIPWDDIKTTCNKIAKSTATFLNGFFETPGLFTSIGTTLGEALNTAFGALNTFATNFKWTSFGKAISDSINSFAETFNVSLAADAFSNTANGILTSLITVLQKTKWSDIGTKIGELLNNIKWAEIFGNVGTAAGEGLNAAFATIGSFAKEFKWDEFGKSLAQSINNFFKTFKWKEAATSASDVITGVLAAITSFFEEVKWDEVGADIAEFFKNIKWGEIWEGIKKAVKAAFTGFGKFLAGLFGLSEDDENDVKTDMEGIGGKIWDGIVAGVKAAIAGIASIGKWILSLFTGNDDDVSTETEGIGTKIWDGIVAGVEAAIGGIAGLGSWIISLFTGWDTAEVENHFKGIGQKIHDLIFNPEGGYTDESGQGVQVAGDWDSFGKGDSNELLGLLGISGLSGLSIALDVALNKDNWTTVQAWANEEQNSGGDAQKSVALSKATSWAGKKVSDWISNSDNWGGTPDKAVGLMRTTAWDTVKSWLEKTAQWGGTPNKPVGLSKATNWAGKKVSEWIEKTSSNWGGTPSKAIGIQKTDGWKGKSIYGWIKTAANWGAGVVKNIGIQQSDGWKGKSIYSWITGSSARWGKGVTKNIGIQRSESWKNKTIYGWITGNYWGGGVTKNIGIQQSDGWKGKTIYGWITGSHWGAAVTKNIGIQQSAGWSGESIASWITGYTSRWGGAVTKDVGLKRKDWTTVGAWVKGFGDTLVSVAVGLSKSFASGGIYRGGRWQPVTAAASGGSFSTGQMFIAREAGPELVGTIGGNTAVMNNSQIVSSVAAGVAQAVASVMSAFLGQMNSGGGDVTIYIDSEELAAAVIRGMRKTDKRQNPQVVFGG